MKQGKIIPGVVAGFVVAILSWALREFAHLELPGEVTAAAVGLLAVLISLATPDAMEASE